ncbi:MAG: recombinase RecA [Leptospirales bacterium]|nr:recombinase RecA [Leptospirales bacterium]
MAKSKKADAKVEQLANKREARQQQDLSERLQAVSGAMQQIERQFGKGAIMKLGDQGVQSEIGYISTGALTLDFALGIGGFPRGRVVEIFGPESSGKTTLCLSAVANAQRQGGIAAFVDAEHAIDPAFARKLGVNIDDLLVAQPDNGEEALEITESLVRSNAVDIIIVDSVAALVPKAELEGNMGDAQMGLHARLMSQALRKLTGTISKSHTTVVFVNQIRHKIGVMFGSPETTTGGNALKFYASVRLDIRRIETLKKGDDAFGNRVRVKIVKNKVAPPFRQAEFDILFERGINREGCLLDLAATEGVIERSGAWYAYQGNRIGQGRDNACQYLRENQETAQEIETELRRRQEESRKQGLNKPGAAEAAPGEPEIDPETGEILESSAG